jgi:electron transport complex protein RnfC
VLSAVSGTVKAIEERMTVSGNLCQSVVIENDNLFATVEGFGTKRNYTALSKEEIRRYIKDAGIVGLGGTGFPTHVKLTPKKDEAVEYVIVNGMECEPYLTADERLMTEEGNKIVEGLKIILQLFENAKGIIAVGDDKKQAIKTLSGLVKKEDRITIKVIKAKYPLGAERQVIQTVTGRKLKASMIPADVGCVVHNVETVLAVYRAVAESIPFIRRVVTVSGAGVKKPQNFQVCFGTSFEELLQAAGGAVEEAEVFAAGGPMRGTALTDLSVPVTKTVGAFTVLKKAEVGGMTSPCIRCGRCMEVCPGHLVPRKLIKYAEWGDKDGFVRLGGMECCECGSCSYICPAGRALTQSFRQLRHSILDERRKR